MKEWIIHSRNKLIQWEQIIEHNIFKCLAYFLNFLVSLTRASTFLLSIDMLNPTLSLKLVHLLYKLYNMYICYNMCIFHLQNISERRQLKNIQQQTEKWPWLQQQRNVIYKDSRVYFWHRFKWKWSRFVTCSKWRGRSCGLFQSYTE